MAEGEYFSQAEGISKVSEKERKRLLPYKEVLKVFGDRLSWHRLRWLLNTGRISGEKRYRKGQRGYPWVWHTTVDAVKIYFSSLKTPSEYGKMEAKRGKRGRTRKRIGRKGVVFQGV